MISSLKERFERHVSPEPNTGCHLWASCRNPKGYGMISWKVRGRWSQRHAHRVAYELYVGPIGDQCVLHRCDTPECVNPDHLFLGTHKDNAVDRESKRRGRQPRGEMHGRSKLKPSDVMALRSASTSGASYASLGRKYGISGAAARDVIRGKNWKHIPMEIGV